MEVVRIKLRLSNAYLIKARKTILLDTGSSGEADRILAAVTGAGVRAGDIALILLTHGHSDHAGSAAELKRRLQVPVAIHAADAGMIVRGDDGKVRPRNLEAALIRPFVADPSQSDPNGDSEGQV